MSVAPESLLALRQVVDDKLPHDLVEKILQTIQINGGENSDHVIQKLTDGGIIDDIITNLRGKPQPEDYPKHVRPRERIETTLDSRKRYLIVDIKTGFSFIDQLTDYCNGVLSKSTIQLHVYFKNDRQSTPMVALCSEPAFNHHFAFILNDDGDDLNNIEQILSSQEALKIIAVKQNVRGESTVLSSTTMEWRGVLESQRHEVEVELHGMKNERSLTIGSLRISMEMVPKFVRPPLARDILNTQYSLERSRNAEKDKLFMLYAKEWWNEYLKLRPEHKSRLVKLYSNDENNLTFPCFTFIWPIRATKIIDSPRIAHRLISSFELELVPDHGIAGKVDIWTSASTILAAKKGDLCGLNILLCSLLLGFGLNSYIAIGFKHNKPWAWIVTIDEDVMFWDAASGERFKHVYVDVELPAGKRDRPKHYYKTIDCLFNHNSFYGNIQLDNRVPVTNFNLKNGNMWKSLDQAAISALQFSRPFAHSPRNIVLHKSTLDPIALSNKIEGELMDEIAEFRRGLDLDTRWDDELSPIIGMAVNAYEVNDLYDVVPDNSEFQSAIGNSIPDGHTFKAFPIRLYTTCSKDIFSTLLQRPISEGILRWRGDNLRFAVYCKIFTYAENSATVWIMLACRYSLLV